jgi:plastocyanin
MSPKRWGRVAFAALVSAILIGSLGGCSSSAPRTGSTAPAGAGAGGTGGGVTIAEQNQQFVPSTLTVKVGDKVTFSNQDSVPHHVFVDTTDLGDQQSGADVVWTAEKDGTFALTCSLHPAMTGQIVVGAGGSSTPPTGGSGTGGGSSAPPPSGYSY